MTVRGRRGCPPHSPGVLPEVRGSGCETEQCHQGGKELLSSYIIIIIYCLRQLQKALNNSDNFIATVFHCKHSIHLYIKKFLDVAPCRISKHFIINDEFLLISSFALL